MCGGVCLEDEGTCRQFYFQEQKKMGAGAGGDRWDVSPGALTGDRAQAGGQPNASNGVLDYLLEAVEDDAVRDTTTFILAGYKDEIEAPPPPSPPPRPALLVCRLCQFSDTALCTPFRRDRHSRFRSPHRPFSILQTFHCTGTATLPALHFTGTAIDRRFILRTLPGSVSLNLLFKRLFQCHCGTLLSWCW